MLEWNVCVFFDHGARTGDHADSSVQVELSLAHVILINGHLPPQPVCQA